MKQQALLVSTLAYSSTTVGDPLRKLLVDMGTQACNMNNFAEVGPDKYHEYFLFDFIVALKDRNIAPGAVDFVRKDYHAIMRSNFCERYHHHGDGEVGDREMKDLSYVLLG